MAPDPPLSDDDFLRSLMDSLGGTDDASTTASATTTAGRTTRRMPFRKKSPKKRGVLSDVTNAAVSATASATKAATVPATPSKERLEKEHAALLAGLDDTFFDWVPTPDPSPAKLKAEAKADIRDGLKEEEKENVELLTLGAENWDWADLLSDVKDEPMLDVTKPAIARREPEPCARCVVETIDIVDTGRSSEKHVHVRVDRTAERRLLILRSDWSLTPLQPGDTLNILGAFLPPPSSHSDSLPSIVLTPSQNTLIHHPDVLLPPTHVSTSSACTRKPLVSSMLRSAPGGQDGIARSILWGNLLHEVVQRCLVSSTGTDGWSRETIESVLHDVVFSREGVEGCFRAGVSIDEALGELRQRAGGLEVFSRRFLGPVPKPEAALSDPTDPSLLALTRTLAIEEDIWSPTYGLKGKIDASVEVAISSPQPSLFAKKGERKEERARWPFEIKTGRASKGMEHRAQTVLYTLLLGERYETEVSAGLLYYTQSDEVIRVPARRNELRGLIMARNELAEWAMRRRRGLDALGRKGRKKGEGSSEDVQMEDGERMGEEVEIEEAPFLPEPIDDAWKCEKCYALDGCMLYRKAIDQPFSVSPAIEDLYSLKTSHLTPIHTRFFRTWERLVSLEENDMHRFRSELWTMSATERESAGRCFAGMVSVPLRPKDEVFARVGESRIHRHTARFVKGGGGSTLLNGHISVGDAIVVSVDPGLLALGRGFVLSLDPESVVLGLDRAVDEAALADLPVVGTGAERVWRIDKDELSSGSGRLRDNLARLFYASGGDEKRRSLVVDLAGPTFDPALAPAPAELSPMLNAPQRMAMEKVATAKDYALILGMPGTGKTSTIAEIIKMLVARGKSVLLTSYTHSAVDTILTRLGEVEFGVLRLGNADKVHPDVKKYTLGARPQATTVEQLEHQLLSPPVVATTCLSIDHPLFSRRSFDYCIVDEASQITLPTCIGPLRFADVFVLVGDHFQLPPLVRNKQARKGGLDISLFRRLSDAHPEAVIDLTLQYRMNEDIMLLSNRLIYSDRLQCGTEEVAKRSLVLPDKSALNDIHGGKVCEGCWIEALLDENCKAIFVDTDDVPALDSRVGSLVQNEVEAKLVYQITQSLLRCGVAQEHIGIISLYRQQIKLLSHLLRDVPDLEILTADRSQGRDKDCVIISMVRSNADGEIGDLLQDWRRINVSFTRARSKLIIFGSRSTLEKAQLLSDFFTLMAEKRWIYRLQPEAHLIHAASLGTASQPPQQQKRLSSGGKEGALDSIAKKSRLEDAACERTILGDIINESL